MSYFDDASLVMIPSGYKNGKVYSVKPTDGTGDLTFTRSNDTATRVGPNGLIEKVRTNLLLQSNSFDTTWVKGGSLTSGQSGYDGSSDAWLYTTTAAGQRIEQSTTITGVQTISVYAKAGNLDWILLNIGGGFFGAYFDLANGVVGSTQSSSGGVTIDTKIQAIGSGWYRISVSGNYSSTSSFRIYTASDDLVTAAGNIYIQDAQLEAGDIATDYIATTSAAVSVGPVANVPRLDYLNSSCPRLLLEPQRTNIQLNSESFDNASWSKTNSAVVANQIVSPDGYVNADKLNETATTGLHQLEGTRTTTAATAYTMSVFAKKGERDFVRLYEDTTSNSAYFNLNTGVVGTVSGPTATAKIEDYGNGWYRCSVTYTEMGIFGRFRISVNSTNGTASYLGVANNGIYIYGAQVEAGAYPTSYVNTLNSAVTRGADACSKTGISSLIGQTEGTLFLDVVAQVDTASSQDFSISDGTANNRASIRLNNSGLINAVGVFGGSVQFSMGTGAYVTGQRYKIALAYKLNDVVLYVNGVQSATDTSATISGTLSRLGFDVNTTGTQNLKSRVNQALLFKTRLTNAQLAELTTL